MCVFPNIGKLHFEKNESLNHDHVISRIWPLKSTILSILGFFKKLFKSKWQKWAKNVHYSIISKTNVNTNGLYKLIGLEKNYVYHSLTVTKDEPPF